MKRLILVLAILFSISLSYAQTKTIQFRIVLSEEEQKTLPSDEFLFLLNKDGPQERIFLDKEILFTNSDIIQIKIINKPEYLLGAAPYLEVTFKNIDKLSKVTGKYVGRRMAVVIDDKVIMVSKINEPINGGTVLITGSGIKTDEDAVNLSKSLGFYPVIENEVIIPEERSKESNITLQPKIREFLNALKSEKDENKQVLLIGNINNMCSEFIDEELENEVLDVFHRLYFGDTSLRIKGNILMSLSGTWPIDNKKANEILRAAEKSDNEKLRQIAVKAFKFKAKAPQIVE